MSARYQHSPSPGRHDTWSNRVSRQSELISLLAEDSDADMDADTDADVGLGVDSDGDGSQLKLLRTAVPRAKIRRESEI